MLPVIATMFKMKNCQRERERDKQIVTSSQLPAPPWSRARRQTPKKSHQLYRFIFWLVVVFAAMNALLLRSYLLIEFSLRATREVPVILQTPQQKRGHHITVPTGNHGSTTSKHQPTWTEPLIQQSIELEKKKSPFLLDGENRDPGQARKPRVILGIGPHKTGTTALQYFVHSNVKQHLKNDGISIPTLANIPGQKQDPFFNFAHCMLRDYIKGEGGGDIPKARCKRFTFPALANYTKQIYTEGKDLLIIAEDLDRTATIDYTRIKKKLWPYEDIHVIDTYRRLVDWYPSWYNQIVKMYMKRYVKQPLKYRFPAFDKWVAGEYDEFLERHTAGLARSYESNGMNVSILNYHANANIIETLFCHLLMAKNTCAEIQRLKSEQVKDQVEMNVGKKDYELCRVALYAYTHNVTGATKPTNKHQCMDAGDALNRRLSFYSMTLRDLPWVYPNSSLVDRMWKDTIELETAYGLVNQSGLDAEVYWTDLRSGFDATIAKKWKSLDVEQMERTGLLHRLFTRSPASDIVKT